MILKEDGYEVAEIPSPGDVILYLSASGDIVHSGVVVEKLEFGMRVLSKWGAAHEVVHLVLDCPYRDQTSSYEYWRIRK